MILNELLAKEVIRNQVDLQRLEAKIRRAALSELIRLDRVLVGLIAQQGGNPQISGLLSLARKEIIKHVDAAKEAALLDEERMIKALAKKTAGDINAVLGAPLATPIMSDKLLASTKAKAVVQGAPASQWWNRQREKTYQNFADIIRTGYITGRTNQQIIADWRRQSGSLKNQATALVRTSVQSMANATLMAVYKENSNVVKGVQAVATLDLRTSGLCRARDGEVWYFGEEGLPKKAPFKKPPAKKVPSIPKPHGTTPVKEGYVRLYHQTDSESLALIEKEGLQLSKAKGIEGPRAIYAGETPFYGTVDSRPTLEFQVPIDKWDSPFVLMDEVTGDNIIAAHYPWHYRVRWFEERPDILGKVIEGGYDDLKENNPEYRQAIEFVQRKYAK